MKEKTSKEGANCVVCGCPIHHGGDDYGKPSVEGRSHATKHHYVAERFLGRSATRKGKAPRKPIFENCPWKLEKPGKFCYECHEELLHNPVLLSEDISQFAKLVRLRGLNESEKTEGRDKIARRIELLHKVIEKGIKTLLVAENQR